MSACLRQESQSLDDPVIQIDEFSFGQYVDVDCHCVPDVPKRADGGSVAVLDAV